MNWPLPIATQAQAIKAACARYAVSLQVFMGMYNNETSLGADVTSSSTGAMGPFQFEPSTAASYGYPLTNTPNDVEFQAQANGAAHYLSDLFHQLHDWRDALAAYNAGPGNIPAGLGYADQALAFGIPVEWTAAFGSAPGVPVLGVAGVGHRPGGKTLAWGDDFSHDHFADHRYVVRGGVEGVDFTIHDRELDALLGAARWYDPTETPNALLSRAVVTAIVTNMQDGNYVGVGITDNAESFPGIQGGLGIVGAFFLGGSPPSSTPSAQISAGNDLTNPDNYLFAQWSPRMPNLPFTISLQLLAPSKAGQQGRAQLQIADSVGTQTFETDIDWDVVLGWIVHKVWPSAAINLSDLSAWSWELDEGAPLFMGSILPGSMAGGSVRGIQRIAGGSIGQSAAFVQQAVSLGLAQAVTQGNVKPGAVTGGSSR